MLSRRRDRVRLRCSEPSARRPASSSFTSSAPSASRACTASTTGAASTMRSERPDGRGRGGFDETKQFGVRLRQNPDTCSDNKRNGANHNRSERLVAPALRPCASPSLRAEYEGESTKNDWCAEEKRQHSYKPQDAADE